MYIHVGTNNTSHHTVHLYVYIFFTLKTVDKGAEKKLREGRARKKGREGRVRERKIEEQRYGEEKEEKCVVEE